RAREGVAIYLPGEIRWVNARSDNGSGDAETCSFHFGGIYVEIQLDDRVKRFILLTRKTPRIDGRGKLIRLFAKERDACLCAPNICGVYHVFRLCSSEPSRCRWSPS